MQTIEGGIISLRREGAASKRYRGVCVVDSFTSANQKEKVPTQGALLAIYLEKSGRLVRRTSSQTSIYMRAVDMVFTLATRHSEYDIALIQVFGRRAFEYACLSSWVAK